MFELTPDDVCYLAMPLFHSNALMAGWAPALAAGATAALRDRFSASQFLPDVRRFGVTYFNYVGKPLSYVLATPEQPDDADNTAPAGVRQRGRPRRRRPVRGTIRLRGAGRLRFDRGGCVGAADPGHARGARSVARSLAP